MQASRYMLIRIAVTPPSFIEFRETMERPCAPLAAKSARRLRPPVRACAGRSAAAGPAWLHEEVKHGGFRVLALKRLELANIRSGRGADFTYSFHQLVRLSVSAERAAGALVCAGHPLSGR
jgi:hypothetical protein